MENTFTLPIGLVFDGKEVKQIPIAETNASAEAIFGKKPSQTKLYTWFGQVIAAASESIGGVPIAYEFLKSGTDKNIIPEPVQCMPLLDVGSMLLQIQRECWESMIKGQRLKCVNCGKSLTADIDLMLIPVPQTEGIAREIVVRMDKTLTIKNPGVEQMSDYEGQRFNHVVFRVPLLKDALKHQEIAKDDLTFWRKIMYECAISLFYQEEGSDTKEEVTDGYLTRKGTQLFDKDFSTKVLKSLRTGIQTSLSTAKMYYEEDCPSCNEPTPFFASVSHFFST